MKQIKTLTTILLLAIFAFTSCSKEELMIDEPKLESLKLPPSPDIKTNKTSDYLWYFYCGNSSTGEHIKVNYEFFPHTYYLWTNGQWKHKSYFEAYKWCQENTTGFN